jgi:RNA polymerase sigma-70 factor (ECF subfamily)
MSASFRDPDLLKQVLRSARGGDADALGRLLQRYRNYLLLVAQTQIGPGLRVRVDASDLVQEVMLEAHRDFTQFVGESEPELTAWLRRMLARNLTDQIRRHRAQRRALQRQESLEALLDRSDAALQEALGGLLSTPSVQAARREQAVLLADALAALPKNYREVIVCRHLERLPFEEIAGRLGRSAGAVRMLWARALRKLSEILEKPL